MKHIKPLPPLEIIKRYLSYDEETGNLIWNGADKYAAQREKGRVAGTPSKGGYLKTSVCGKQYNNARLVWKLYYGRDPDGVIDHIDGDKRNNRIANLRDVTQRENMYNSAIRSDSPTGVKGVVYDGKAERYRINLKVDGERMYAGKGFDTLEEARNFLERKRETLHGEFTCHGHH